MADEEKKKEIEPGMTGAQLAEILGWERMYATLFELYMDKQVEARVQKFGKLSGPEIAALESHLLCRVVERIQEQEAAFASLEKKKPKSKIIIPGIIQ